MPDNWAFVLPPNWLPAGGHEPASGVSGAYLSRLTARHDRCSVIVRYAPPSCRVSCQYEYFTYAMPYVKCCVRWYAWASASCGFPYARTNHTLKFRFACHSA